MLCGAWLPLFANCFVINWLLAQPGVRHLREPTTAQSSIVDQRQQVRPGLKLAVAQDTVEEMAKSMANTEAGSTQASAAELYAFLKRVAPSPQPWVCMDVC